MCGDDVGVVEDLLARIEDEELRLALCRAWDRRVPASRHVTVKAVPTPLQPDRLGVSLEVCRAHRDFGAEWVVCARADTCDGHRVVTQSFISTGYLQAVRSDESEHIRVYLHRAVRDAIVNCVDEQLSHARIRWKGRGRHDFIWTAPDAPLGLDETSVNDIIELLLETGRPGM